MSPVTDFTKAVAVRGGGANYPKFSLKNGEKARVAIVEFPESFWVHSLESIVIGEDGEAVKITKTTRDNEAYEAFKTKFMGRYLCKGDEETLQANGSDPKNCLICDYATKFPKRAKSAEQRFALHILRYNVKPGTAILPEKNFGGDVQVWSFTGTVFNRLHELNEEFSDIRKIDLILGPCQNENFQKFDISPGSGKAEWLKAEERKQYVKDVLSEGRIPDLSVAAGKDKEDKFLKMDLELISDSWDIAEGVKSASDDGDIWSSDEDDDKPAKKSKAKPAAKKEKAKPAPVVEDDDDDEAEDLLSEIDDEKPKGKKSKAKAEDDDDDADITSELDDILNG